MSNWRYTVDLHDLYVLHEEKKISLSELSKGVSKYLKEFAEKYVFNVDWKEDLLSIAEDFEGVDEVEEFDDVLSDLYDWGDQDIPRRMMDNPNIPSKLAWIKFRW